MKNELVALFNTMSLIETNGESTMKMSSCLRLVKRLISELNAQEANKDCIQESDEGGETNEFHDNEPNN